MKFLQMNNQQAYSDWMQISSSVSVLAKKVWENCHEPVKKISVNHLVKLSA